MKKIFLLLFSLAAVNNAIHSQLVPGGTISTTQVCTCNPNGWQPVITSINNIVTTVNCGHQFSLKCSNKITLKSEYKCLGNCLAKYKAVLKNNTTGVVVMTYASFTFPWSYSFATAGNYSLEITPICGTTNCTPCRFFFTVTCPVATCDCDVNGWKPFTSYIGTTKQTVNCGFQFSIKKGQAFKLAGEYKCKGTCVAKYMAVLKNNVTGAVVQNYPAFSFVWPYTFGTVGNYKLEIIPICGDKRCTPCIFYFTVI